MNSDLRIAGAVPADWGPTRVTSEMSEIIWSFVMAGSLFVSSWRGAYVHFEPC